MYFFCSGVGISQLTFDGWSMMISKGEQEGVNHQKTVMISSSTVGIRQNPVVSFCYLKIWTGLPFLDHLLECFPWVSWSCQSIGGYWIRLNTSKEFQHQHLKRQDQKNERCGHLFGRNGPWRKLANSSFGLGMLRDHLEKHVSVLVIFNFNNVFDWTDGCFQHLKTGISAIQQKKRKRLCKCCKCCKDWLTSGNTRSAAKHVTWEWF